ncbi:helix-turn-helix domain-containing protein [Hymenobacter elongatus]|uniref:Uncharacterized protein n=1 Tax=Hymenobacter elongatus TaxID=877208 RepID=A0A4Z0PP01_9BACT|nr:helix-turn-helix domain-containing protein [Hymenobacter elongatus]TGE18064.1 hypothetical protein E5J99_05895 [Hymenobacter elongatus]
MRELKNVLERAVILADHDLLTVDDLPAELHYLSATPTITPNASHDRPLRTAELHHIRQVLAEAHGNKAKAARMLNVAVTTLYRKRQEYGLEE